MFILLVCYSNLYVLLHYFDKKKKKKLKKKITENEYKMTLSTTQEIKQMASSNEIYVSKNQYCNNRLSITQFRIGLCVCEHAC